MDYQHERDGRMGKHYEIGGGEWAFTMEGEGSG